MEGLMSFDELLKIDLNEGQEHQKELEALRAANKLPQEGTCPECQRVSGDLIIGHMILGFCTEHRFYWRVGTLRKDFKDEQRAKWNQLGMEEYKEVKGWVTGMRRTAGDS
jgi:hypothetical protein